MKNYKEYTEEYDDDVELVLLIDMDDLFVRSAPFIQKNVNDKTNFKTETLNMLEQFIRNCTFVIQEVTKECNKAKEEERYPDLSRFGIFDGIKFDDNNIYSKPIDIANEYKRIASKLYNQFLEERDVFLEVDNLYKTTEGSKSRIYFDDDKETKVLLECSKLISENMDAFHKINLFAYNEVDKLVTEAEKTRAYGEVVIPDFGPLVNMDNNDIVKNGELNGEIDREEILYKPLIDTYNCLKYERNLQDVVTNGDAFFNPSEELVDYKSIHSVANVNWDAVFLIWRLIKSGRFKKICISTHHNGTREIDAKLLLVKLLFPQIPIEYFLEHRFHDKKHDAERRGRSSKPKRAKEKLHIEYEQIVQLDDSKVNCQDCKDRGGLAIIYKPLTDAEKIKGRVDDLGFPRILDFEDPNNFDMIMDAIDEHLRKIKGKRKVLK